MRDAISPEAAAAIADMLAMVRPAKRDLRQDRANWTAEAALEPLPNGTTIEEAVVGGIRSEWVRTGPADGVFLLLHGGGYVNGNCITHRKLAALISQASGLDVLVPDYRLAPENPFPAGLDDALAVWQALLSEHDNTRLFLGGDSAGAGLSLALLLAARDQGLTLPRACALLSPWTDILARGESYESNRAADPTITKERLLEAGAWYVGAGNPDDPLISPIGADLTGLPPLLVHVGGIEAMLDDSLVFADRAQAAGLLVDLKVWPGMWHVWHHYAFTVPEASDAIADIGQFLRQWS